MELEALWLASAVVLALGCSAMTADSNQVKVLMLDDSVSATWRSQE